MQEDIDKKVEETLKSKETPKTVQFATVNDDGTTRIRQSRLTPEALSRMLKPSLNDPGKKVQHSTETTVLSNRVGEKQGTSGRISQWLDTYFKNDNNSIFFPDGKKQASQIISSLASICDINLDTCSDKDLFELIHIYISVISRMHIVGMDDTEEKAVDYLMRKNSILKDKTSAIKSLYCSRIIYDAPSFSLLDERTKTMFEFVVSAQTDEAIKKENQSQTKKLPFFLKKTNSVSLAPSYKNALNKRLGNEFSFLSQLEYDSYCNVHRDNNSVKWIGSRKYGDLYFKGYYLFSAYKHIEAIRVMLKALEINPVGVQVRFKLSTYYLTFNDFESAKLVLNDLAPYINHNSKWIKTMGTFYQTYGEIFKAEGNNQLVALCYTLSATFYKHCGEQKLYEHVLMEADALTQKYNYAWNTAQEIGKCLSKNNIPSLTIY